MVEMLIAIALFGFSASKEILGYCLYENCIMLREFRHFQQAYKNLQCYTVIAILNSQC